MDLQSEAKNIRGGQARYQNACDWLTHLKALSAICQKRIKQSKPLASRRDLYKAPFNSTLALMFNNSKIFSS